VAPQFFLHRWEVRKGKNELVIDIPRNINEILMKSYNPDYEGGVEVDIEPYDGLIH